MEPDTVYVQVRNVHRAIATNAKLLGRDDLRAKVYIAGERCYGTLRNMTLRTRLSIASSSFILLPHWKTRSPIACYFMVDMGICTRYVCPVFRFFETTSTLC